MGNGRGYFTGYPKSIFLILGNEFCERFSIYGMTVILILYLRQALKLTEPVSKEVFHAFAMVGMFTPLFGAMVADGCLGRYKVILSFSVIHAIGNVMMAVSAIQFSGEHIRVIAYAALLLLAVGGGGIKPCVSAFGADQFKDDQERQKESFFSLFYMIINIGSVTSMFISPIIRSNVRCFGDQCYALAFALPAVLMILAVVLFAIGTPWYIINPPGENIVGNFFGSIFFGLRGKLCCSKSGIQREHWLDYADSKYDKSFIDDVKQVFRIMFVFTPFPVFFALYTQLGSLWIFQATQLDNQFGSFSLPPDMIPIVNPFLVVLLVPLLESCFYPCLDKLNIPNRLHHRMLLGMLLAATAFSISGILQIYIDKALPTSIAQENGRIKVLNALPCDISGSIMDMDNKSVHVFEIPHLKRATDNFLTTIDVAAEHYSLRTQVNHCPGNNMSTFPVDFGFTVENQRSHNLIIHWDKVEQRIALERASQPSLHQAEDGGALLQFVNLWSDNQIIHVEYVKDAVNATLRRTTEAVYLPIRRTELGIGNHTFELVPLPGAVYTAVLHYDSTGSAANAETLTAYQDITHNTISLLLMIPQFCLLTLSELFFIVSAQAFAYTQSPKCMKSVLQACFLLTGTIGNFVVMVITAIGTLPNKVAECFFYAGLMYLTAILYGLLINCSKVVQVIRQTSNLKGKENDGLEEDIAINMVSVQEAETPVKGEVKSQRF